MKSKITSHTRGIDVDITEVEGKMNELLGAFQDCQEGKCSCPTQEYEKVESLEIASEDGAIRLSIKAKDGNNIVKNEIEKCLEYTSNKISET